MECVKYLDFLGDKLSPPPLIIPFRGHKNKFFYYLKQKIIRTCIRTRGDNTKKLFINKGFQSILNILYFFLKEVEEGTRPPPP